MSEATTQPTAAASRSLLDRLLGLRFLFVPTGTALVLLMSINLLWPRKSVEPAPQAVEASAPAFELGESTEDSAGSKSAVRDQLSLSECIANNPFDVPESLQSAITEPKAEQPASSVADVPPPPAEINAEENAWRESLLQKRIQVVYQSSRGTVAVVDSHIIHAGDTLDDCRVIEVRLDGVVLERLAPVVGASASLDVALPLFAPHPDHRRSEPILRASANSRATPDRAVLPIPNVPRANTGKSTDETVSLVVRDAPVRQVVEVIAHEHGWTIEGKSLPEEHFTVSLFDLPLHDVLEIILQPRGLAWARDAERLLISEPAAAEPVMVSASPVVRMFLLKYVSQADVERVLPTLLSRRGKTHFAPASDENSRTEMLVLDEPEAVARVESYLAQADRSPPHVMIEAHVLQVGLSGNTWQGVSLLPLAAEQNGLPGAEGSRHLRFPSDRSGTVLPSLQTMLGAQLIASPELLVVSGERAVTQVQGSGYRVDLRVTPRVAGDGRVWLRVSTALAGMQEPESETTVLLADGGTLVIGGLIHEHEVEMIARRRFLSELPIIGQRFQQRYTVPVRTEVLLALKPRIVGETVAGSLAGIE